MEGLTVHLDLMEEEIEEELGVGFELCTYVQEQEYSSHLLYLVTKFNRWGVKSNILKHGV